MIWKRWIVFAFAAIATSPGLLGTTLVVHVVADTGSPVSGVVAAVQTTKVTSPTITTYRSITDAQGKITVTVPAPGSYSVCVGAPNRALLNSCEWNLSSSIVQVSASQSIVNAKITLQTGSFLTIRLDDPLQLVSLPTVQSTAKGSVQFGVWGTDGNFHNAAITSSDSKGSNSQILLPPNQDFRLAIQASQVHVLNQASALVDNVPGATFHVQGVGSLQPLRYQVSAIATAVPIAQ